MAGTATSPEQAYELFAQEIDIVQAAGRSGQPTRDPLSRFFGLPFDDFTNKLRELRDEIEDRAYLAIVAATEAVVQLDFRARARGKASVVLRDQARKGRKEEAKGRRIDVEQVLDAWASLPRIRRDHVAGFRQLLRHRHWLAHGRYFPPCRAVPGDPGFACHRARALLSELARIDPSFPRG